MGHATGDSWTACELGHLTTASQCSTWRHMATLVMFPSEKWPRKQKHPIEQTCTEACKMHCSYSENGRFRNNKPLVGFGGDSSLWSNSSFYILFQKQGWFLKLLEECPCLSENCLSSERQTLSKSWEGITFDMNLCPGNTWFSTEIGLERNVF